MGDQADYVHVRKQKELSTLEEEIEQLRSAYNSILEQRLAEAQAALERDERHKRERGKRREKETLIALSATQEKHAVVQKEIVSGRPYLKPALERKYSSPASALLNSPAVPVDESQGNREVRREPPVKPESSCDRGDNYEGYDAGVGEGLRESPKQSSHEEGPKVADSRLERALSSVSRASDPKGAEIRIKHRVKSRLERAESQLKIRLDRQQQRNKEVTPYDHFQKYTYGSIGGLVPVQLDDSESNSGEPHFQTATTPERILDSSPPTTFNGPSPGPKYPPPSAATLKARSRDTLFSNLKAVEDDPLRPTRQRSPSGSRSRSPTTSPRGYRALSPSAANRRPAPPKHQGSYNRFDNVKPPSPTTSSPRTPTDIKFLESLLRHSKSKSPSTHGGVPLASEPPRSKSPRRGASPNRASSPGAKREKDPSHPVAWEDAVSSEVRKKKSQKQKEEEEKEKRALIIQARLKALEMTQKRNANRQLRSAKSRPRPTQTTSPN